MKPLKIGKRITSAHDQVRKLPIVRIVLVTLDELPKKIGVETWDHWEDNVAGSRDTVTSV